jgi:hypothetical protein
VDAFSLTPSIYAGSYPSRALAYARVRTLVVPSHIRCILVIRFAYVLHISLGSVPAPRCAGLYAADKTTRLTNRELAKRASRDPRFHLWLNLESIKYGKFIFLFFFGAFHQLTPRHYPFGLTLHIKPPNRHTQPTPCGIFHCGAVNRAS